MQVVSASLLFHACLPSLVLLLGQAVNGRVRFDNLDTKRTRESLAPRGNAESDVESDKDAGPVTGVEE